MNPLALENLEELAEFEPPEQLPVELALDPYHPDNDAYTQRSRTLKAHIVTQSRKLKPMHVKIARHHLEGMNNAKISRTLGVNPMTVANVLKRPEVQKFLTYLHHYNRHEEGATITHRKAILYRIALDNEKERPNTSITAIQEMNKIDGVYKEANDIGKVEIVINANGFLPSTILDVTPEGVPEREAN